MISENARTSNICDVYSTQDSKQHSGTKIRVIIFVPWTFQRHFRASFTFDGADAGNESHAVTLNVKFHSQPHPVNQGIFLLHQKFVKFRFFHCLSVQ